MQSENRLTYATSAYSEQVRVVSVYFVVSETSPMFTAAAYQGIVYRSINKNTQFRST